MLYSTFLSTAILTTSAFVYATPVAAEQNLAEKATVIPFVNQHAAARNSENYSHSAVLKRDLDRARKINEHIAAVKRSGEPKKRKRAAALEPYDIAPARRAAFNKRQGNSAAEPLINPKDSLAYGTLAVGTPAQAITIQFDTYTSDLLIPVIDCTTCVGPVFNPNSSATFNNLNITFDEIYGNTDMVLNATGVVATDTIAIGSLAVANQTFAAITDLTGQFEGPFSGVMGLAWESLARTNATPWFFNLVNQGALASNLFSFYFSRKGEDGSELCIGCIDSTKFTGQPEYIPLFGDNIWETIGFAFAYNNTVVTEGVYNVFIDSKASNIYLPPSQAAPLYAAIPGAQIHTDNTRYVFPCASVSSMGPVGITFYGSTTVFNIQPSRFNLGPIEEGSDMCVGAIMATEELDIVLLGEVFMNSWYTIIDHGNWKLGFAKAV